MIIKEKGELICECNECGSTEYAGTLEFMPFIDELKDKGWKIKKDGEEWTHTCPDCQD